MVGFDDRDVSRAIFEAYHAKFANVLESDVIIVGAGPSGMVAAWRMAEAGLKVLVLEKRLSIGGGIWGGAIGMNEIVVQEDALHILKDAGVRHQPSGSLFTADALELASALCLKALQAGATMLNLMMAEDIRIQNGRVTGVVANRTMLGDSLPIDPIVFASRAVIDTTGHETVMVNCLQKRGLLPGGVAGEGPMDAASGEAFVVEKVAELFPGLWTSGMSVSASQGGPRMGPIFGGMLQSGEKVAAQIRQALQ